MKLLLHVCCGPCFEYPADVFKKEKIDFTAYFYNPNIHPDWEYKRRIDAFKKLAELKNYKVEYNTPNHEEISAWVKTNEITWGNYDKEKRCEMCYTKRLEETAKFASDNGYKAFSTTLLLSIYQDHDLIVKIGKEIGEKYNIEFYSKDFREGFRIGQSMAKDDNLYRQKYCGCICSLNQSALKEKIISNAPIK